MMRFALRSAFALACMVPALAVAGDGDKKTDSDRILSAGREESRVMDHLDHLTNRIGSRLTSSDALTTACEWSVNQFKSFGIENARIEKWGEFPVGFNRGPWTGRMVEPEVKGLTFGTDSWSAGTKGVVKGKAVLAPLDEEGLAKVKGDLAGAWIVIPTSSIFRFGSAAKSNFQKTLDAAYDEAKIAGFVRSTRSDLIHTDGYYKVNFDKLPDRTTINLRKDDYDDIIKRLKDEKTVVLEFDVRNYFKKGPIPLYNVIADIPGTEFPDEYVIVGGHIDSWDGATGTCDNGTGCATTLEAARILMKSGVRPRRTIRFMLWSGEEQGLLGSQAYVKAHPEILPKISAVLVHDGGTNYLSGILATKAMKTDMDAAMAPLIGLDEAMKFTVREVAALPRGIGSDHDTFLFAGVPGFFWNQAGKANYNRIHHTQYDTYDGAIPEYQKHSAVVVALGAHGVAGLDHMLSREAMFGSAPAPNVVNRRMLGVQLDDLKVVEVIEDGLGAKAGIKVGDELVKVGEKTVADRGELVAELQKGDPAKKITVKRDDKEVEITVTFPAKP